MSGRAWIVSVVVARITISWKTGLSFQYNAALAETKSEKNPIREGIHPAVEKNPLLGELGNSFVAME